jgi:hypothetical protein
LNGARTAAKRVTVAGSTSFRWRHRFLAGVTRERPSQLTGIVEADETYELESQKGSRHLTRAARRRGGHASRPGITKEFDCVLVARDRSGATRDFITSQGETGKAALLAALAPVLADDMLLVTDGAVAYKAAAKALGIMHRVLNGKARVRAIGTLHIQNVNAWHGRFKTWLVHFHGVASRYLGNYSSCAASTASCAIQVPISSARVCCPR